MNLLAVLLFARGPSRLGALSFLAAIWLVACGGGSAQTTTTAAATSTGSTTTDGGSTSTTSGGTTTGTTTATGKIYVVGAAASLPSGATRVAGLTDVPWSSLPAGSSVIVSPGTYAGPVTITAQGTAANPIVVRASDTTNLPVVSNSVDFQQAAWVQLSNVVVQSPTFAGFIIRRASHHITVADSVVRGGPLGMEITDAAGTGNVLIRNRVEDSAAHGIGVDGVNADPADPSLIQYNTVLRSGQHGMEIRGSNYRIEHNNVSLSGQATGGTSGIHLYRFGTTDIAVAGNLIRYNYSYLNTDTKESDGNGIQVDQWCDGNTVAFNVVWGNDGAGLIVYDGNNNQIYGNTARDNGRDPAKTHGGLGELIVDGSGDTTRPAGNAVYDNVLVSTRANVPAMYVDTRAAAQSSNRFGPNLLFNSAGGTVLRWTDSSLYTSVAQVNAATGSTGNLVSAPSFADVTTPLSGGLRLTAFPGATGLALAGQTDLAGQLAQNGWASFGAYFTAP